MPIITLDEMLQSIGIGASEVGAVCHLSPFTSAYKLWQVKTGRRDKDPISPAMQFGIDMESRALKCYYRLNGIHQMEQRLTQVCAVHPKLPFLRGMCDGWNGIRGVEVKTPSGIQLLDDAGAFDQDGSNEDDHFNEGIIPPHYLCQCAAYMDMFGVEEWDFFVYWAEEDWGVTLKARWDEMWDPRRTLLQFWTGTAIPLMQEFWRRMTEDEWVDSPDWPVPPTEDWMAAIEQRRSAMDQIKELKKIKDEATADLKQMMGFQSSMTVGGWNAYWQERKGSAEAVIKCHDAETVERILPSLLPLVEADGVESVENGSRDSTLAFVVKSMTPKQVAKGEL